MKRRIPPLLLYAVMAVVFGTLIYFALQYGERFDGAVSVPSNAWRLSDAFGVFTGLLHDNLRTPVTVLMLQIIVILFTVRLFSLFFRWIGQPEVVGEILAGIVLGPSLLGHYFPDAFAFVFPTHSLTNLGLLSQIGLILFMFVVGMELDFGMLRKRLNETLVISHAGIFVPFFLGVVTSVWVYETYASGHTPFLPFALFIGISMSITAFPVLAHIVRERKLMNTPVGILSMASAANDDVTAWCLLSVVIAVAKAGTFVSALFTIFLVLVYIVFMFRVVRPLLERVARGRFDPESLHIPSVGFIFLILILSSVATEIMGIHALFGAFMAGVIMPPNIRFRKTMMGKVEDIALSFFLPLFFVYTGLRTEIGLINTPELWLVCLLFIGMAVAGKLGGCALAARLSGESWRNSLTVGTLMNTRGLMELVALNIGYEMGVLPPSLFVILVIMALVTTFMTTPLLALIDSPLFRKKRVPPASVSPE